MHFTISSVNRNTSRSRLQRCAMNGLTHTAHTTCPPQPPNTRPTRTDS